MKANSITSTELLKTAFSQQPLSLLSSGSLNARELYFWSFLTFSFPCTRVCWNIYIYIGYDFEMSCSRTENNLWWAANVEAVHGCWLPSGEKLQIISLLREGRGKTERSFHRWKAAILCSLHYESKPLSVHPIVAVRIQGKKEDSKWRLKTGDNALISPCFRLTDPTKPEV